MFIPWRRVADILLPYGVRTPWPLRQTILYSMAHLLPQHRLFLSFVLIVFLMGQHGTDIHFIWSVQHRECRPMDSSSLVRTGTAPNALLPLSREWHCSSAPTPHALRAVPTAETGPYHHTAIEYTSAKRSRVETLQGTGDSRPALQHGSRSRMRSTLVA